MNHCLSFTRKLIYQLKGMENEIEKLSKKLIDRELTIAFAESATAGRLCAEFSLVSNAGKFLKGGLVCYDAGLKQNILQVPEELIKECTPESPEVTRAITEGLRYLIRADIHVGVTGLPDSGGSETPEKPVGTMFAYATYKGQQLFSVRMIFSGTPREIIEQTLQWVAKSITDSLPKNG